MAPYYQKNTSRLAVVAMYFVALFALGCDGLFADLDELEVDDDDTPPISEEEVRVEAEISAGAHHASGEEYSVTGTVGSSAPALELEGEQYKLKVRPLVSE